MDRIFDATLYVRNVPDIRYEADDDLFMVAYSVGEVHAEFAMRPAIFNKAMVVADAARSDWQQRQSRVRSADNVTKLRRRRH